MMTVLLQAGALLLIFLLVALFLGVQLFWMLQLWRRRPRPARAVITFSPMAPSCSPIRVAAGTLVVGPDGRHYITTCEATVYDEPVAIPVRERFPN